MAYEHIWGLPADQSTQLIERSIPVVCHRCCHHLYLMRPYCRKVWFWRVLVGEANSFGHPATEMSGEHLGFRSEVHSFCCGSSSASSWEWTMYSPRVLTGQSSLSGSLLNKWVIPGYSKGFGRVFSRAFLGMYFGTSRIETCLAPDGNLEKIRLWSALDRVTNSDPQAPVAKATRKAVLYDSNSGEMFLSDPSTHEGWFHQGFENYTEMPFRQNLLRSGTLDTHSTQ